MKTDFYAKTRADEAKCPDLELNILLGIEDVTSKVNGALKPGMSAAQADQAQRAAMANVEQECTKSTGLRCDVVTFYSARSTTSTSTRSTPTCAWCSRPSLTPHLSAAIPTISFISATTSTSPFSGSARTTSPSHLDHYLHWSPTRAKENELISVSGSPGSTQRFLTMAQLEFLRDVDYPTRMEIYKSTDAALKNFSSQSEENARIAKEDIFGIENNIKRFIGYQEGLHDKQTMDLKAADEPRFRSTPGVSRKRYERFTALMRWLTN